MPSFHTFEKINASFVAVVCHETIHIESTALRPTRESRAHLLCACCCAAKLGSWGESGVSTARGEGGEGGRACTEAELCGAKKGSKRSRSQHASLPMRRDSVQDTVPMRRPRLRLGTTRQFANKNLIWRSNTGNEASGSAAVRGQHTGASSEGPHCQCAPTTESARCLGLAPAGARRGLGPCWRRCRRRGLGPCWRHCRA